MPYQFFSISQENAPCALKSRGISLKEVAQAFLTTGSAGRECPQSGNVNDQSGRKATIGKRSLRAKSGPSHRHKIRIGVKGIRKLSLSLLPLDNCGDAVMRA